MMSKCSSFKYILYIWMVVCLISKSVKNNISLLCEFVFLIIPLPKPFSRLEAKFFHWDRTIWDSDQKTKKESWTKTGLELIFRIEEMLFVSSNYSNHWFAVYYRQTIYLPYLLIFKTFFFQLSLIWSLLVC